MAKQPFAVEEGLEVRTTTGTSKKTRYLRGPVDPSEAPGVAAPISSQYNRESETESEVGIYQKFGPLDTDWRLMALAGDSGVIGTAEDGDYTDGLFTDFTNSTPTGTAVDRFNEVLKALAPPPAPGITDHRLTSTGVTGKLSFGATNTIAGYTNVTAVGSLSAEDINDSFSASGDRRGIFNGNTTLSGILADNVAAHSYAYPADSFGNGNQGTLELEVNGVVVHTVDLSTFGSGNSLNGNGSGFNLSSATSVEFSGGETFDQFKYRTGTLVIDPADQRDGHNYVRVNHNTGSDNWTNYSDWVNDSDVTTLSTSAAVLDNLVLTGSKYLSGVQYNTGGTAEYDVTISNPHRNIYPTTAITFSTSNCTASSSSFGNIASEAEDEVITNKSVVINASRLLDQSISIGVNVSHPLKSNLSNSSNLSINGILLDNVSANSTAVVEFFNDENYRLQDDDVYADQSDIASNTWDSTQNILSGSAGHTNGLLIYSSTLRYPTQGLDSGDFRNVADGNANGPENGLAGNPDYTASSGNKVFYRNFVNNTGLTKSNFKINIGGSSTTFASVGSGPSGNAVTVEIKFPNGSISTATGWMDMYGDFATNQWSDGDGARNSTAGVGRALSTDWGGTFGTKSIANGESVVVRVTAADSWSGNLSQITFTWQ